MSNLVPKKLKRNKGTKQCVVCEKDFEAFSKVHKYCSDSCKDKFNGSTSKSRVRRSAYTKEWNQKNKDHRRNYQLQYTYGITLEKYYELLKEQEDCCAVCKRHISTSKKLFAVDHDHKTGEIFGILCDYCNRQLIGRIRKPHLFLEAAKYLEKGKGLFVPEKKKKRKRTRKRIKR